jgi:hypothetical protein
METVKGIIDSTRRQIESLIDTIRNLIEDLIRRFLGLESGSDRIRILEVRVSALEGIDDATTEVNNLLTAAVTIGKNYAGDVPSDGNIVQSAVAGGSIRRSH